MRMRNLGTGDRGRTDEETIRVPTILSTSAGAGEHGGLMGEGQSKTS